MDRIVHVPDAHKLTSDEQQLRRMCSVIPGVYGSCRVGCCSQVESTSCSFSCVFEVVWR